MSKSVSISGVVITFNEEQNIERCLSSFKDIVDEIIVVDSNSTDATVAIARSIGAKVVNQNFLGHIEQKNFAASLATQDVILSLDADEVLSPELKESIVQIKKNFVADGYKFNRLTNYAGHWVRHGGWYPDTKLRLWKAGSGSWQGQNPHDEFRLSEGKPVKLKGDLLHYSIDSVEEHKKVIEKFSSIAAKAMYSKSKKGYWYKQYFNPFVKFIKYFFLKLGFLDGRTGFIVAWYSSYATYLKYNKLGKLYAEN